MLVRWNPLGGRVLSSLFFFKKKTPATARHPVPWPTPTGWLVCPPPRAGPGDHDAAQRQAPTTRRDNQSHTVADRLAGPIKADTKMQDGTWQGGELWQDLSSSQMASFPQTWIEAGGKTHKGNAHWTPPKTPYGGGRIAKFLHVVLWLRRITCGPHAICLRGDKELELLPLEDKK